MPQRWKPWQFWRCAAPASLVHRWLQDGVEHPITQRELLAAAISLQVWGPALASCFMTLWIDNDAVRHSIISGNAYPESNRLIVQACLTSEANSGLRLWVARVPSVSNPSDAPSNGEIPAFLQSATEIKVDVGIVWKLAEGWPE